MSSLKADFNELIKRIKTGRELGHASFEPIFYLVFSPKQLLDVKRQMPAWTAKLKNEGWKVNIFSIAAEINKILEAAPLRKIWLAADARAPLQWDKTNKALAMPWATVRCKKNWKRCWKTWNQTPGISCWLPTLKHCTLI